LQEGCMYDKGPPSGLDNKSVMNMLLQKMNVSILPQFSKQQTRRSLSNC